MILHPGQWLCRNWRRRCLMQRIWWQLATLDMEGFCYCFVVWCQEHDEHDDWWRSLTRLDTEGFFNALFSQDKESLYFEEEKSSSCWHQVPHRGHNFPWQNVHEGGGKIVELFWWQNVMKMVLMFYHDQFNQEFIWSLWGWGQCWEHLFPDFWSILGLN